MKYLFFIFWGQYDHLQGLHWQTGGTWFTPNMITFHWCCLYYLELIVSWTVKLLEVETAFVKQMFRRTSCKTGTKTVLWIFVGAALNLFGQVYWPCSEILKIHVFFRIYKLLYKTWVGPLPRTVTTRTTFFLEGGCQTKPSFSHWHPGWGR